MAMVILHFGYFDREALCQGRLQHREPSRSSRIRLIFQQIFGALPGASAGPAGFFSSYGVLSCVCPGSSREERPPVESIVDLVRQTGCDVVYVSSGTRWIIEADRLADVLCPESWFGAEQDDDEDW